MDKTGTIGIIGGGQLGRMLTLAAIPLGFKVVVVDPGPNCPAAQVGARQIVAKLDDETAVRQLAEQVDYLTIEIEHVDARLLGELAALGTPVNPSPLTIAMIQDKLAQKQFLHDAGLPVAPFTIINDHTSAETALAHYGKMVIKTRRGGYDGRGNAVVSQPAEVAVALAEFEGQELYAEKFVPFKKELAVMVARSHNGEVVTYPVVETIQQRNICTEVLAPAPVSEITREEAEAVARLAAKQLKGAGVFGIELFLTNDNRIVVNEIAPRVHNSGHYTTEACKTSQFEQHIRAITGMPLGPTDLVAPAAVMLNVLGERNGPTAIEGLEKAAANPQTTVHLYGKSPTKIDRKMGHITAIGDTLDEARKRARTASDHLSV
jgi:5-(carboxyamino)imidazole ribonucleotide synthase